MRGMYYCESEMNEFELKLVLLIRLGCDQPYILI